jgi:predicted HTH domain antitoxin
MILGSVVTVRMDSRLIGEIDEIARRERSDRASVLRRLVSDGLDRYRLRMAADAYRDGKVTTERAAVMAGVSVHEMIEALRREGIPSQLGLEDLRRESAAMLRKAGKEELADRILKG